MLRAAFAAGITPREFWGLSFFEFRACLAGRADRDKERLRLEAWSTAHIVNCWADEDSRVTGAELLGEEPEGVPITSREELARNMAVKKARARMEDV